MLSLQISLHKWKVGFRPNGSIEDCLREMLHEKKNTGPTPPTPTPLPERAVLSLQISLHKWKVVARPQGSIEDCLREMLQGH